MGYTTEFTGSFNLDKPLDDDTYHLLKGLSETRRMKRRGLDPRYGVDGEYYFNPDSTQMGQERESSIVDYNEPPSTQPGLWLNWAPTDDRLAIEWNGTEKFYDYEEWLVYIIDRVLAPKGYSLNGEVRWMGEDRRDNGTLTVIDNDVFAVSDHDIVKQKDEAIDELIRVAISSGASSSLLTAKNPLIRQKAKEALSK